MKIRSFGIENFKSLESVLVNKCSDFHALIGENSAGKTSIFDALNLIKLISKNFPNPQLVTKGIPDFEKKSIVVDVHIDLDDDERRNYLLHSFHIVENKTEELLLTNALREIHLEITIFFYGDKAVNKLAEYLVFPSLLEITTDSKNNKMIKFDGSNIHTRNPPTLSNDLRKRTFENYLVSIGYTKNAPNSQQYFQESLFSGRFLRDFISNIRYIEAIRETHKTVDISFFEHEASIGERGEQLANFMDTL